MAATDERKPVTVLFADLAGSTELATRHDPEHLRALLSAFFDEMRQQIESYGGTVEKYAGDAIMAVFGAYGRFKLAQAPVDGRQLIERARVTFGEIGATGWLAEAEEALRA